jgi:hypothetical protein
MIKNNLITFNPKNQILNKNNIEDKIEIEKREKNTFYNKIIIANNEIYKEKSD